MTHTFKLARRTARFRAIAAVAAFLVVSACDNSDRLAPVNADGVPVATGDVLTGADEGVDTLALPSDTVSDAEAEANEALPEAAFVSSSRTRGIVFGQFQMKNAQLTSVYNGAFRLPSAPSQVLPSLASARARGGRVLIQFSGFDHTVKNRNGTFSLAKWKARVARYKSVKFDSYIKDGTLIGHFLTDEPEDPSNWGGRTIPQKTVEEMARYSKKLWPGLTTVIRGKPAYLAAHGMRYKYLDAGWAMYQSWQGNPTTWIRTQNAAARRAGLKLIVGLNLLNGGTRVSGIRGTKGRFYAMSPTQIKAWGALMLNESRSTACGFFNWKYDTRYFSRSAVKSALTYLSSKTRSAPRVSCR